MGVVRGVELATNKGRPSFFVCFLRLVEKLLAVVLFLFEGADAHCIIMTLMTYVSFGSLNNDSVSFCGC